MLSYTSPTSFLKTPEGKLTALLLASAIGMTACGGASGSSGAASSAARPSAEFTVGNCHNGDVVDGPNGSKLYCEELQASSANVFRDIRNLSDSQVPQQLRLGDTVLVKCVQDAPIEWATTAHDDTGQYSAWYVLPNGDVTAANNFWNVDDATKAAYIKNHTPLNQQPAVAKNVSSCGPPITR